METSSKKTSGTQSPPPPLNPPCATSTIFEPRTVEKKQLESSTSFTPTVPFWHTFRAKGSSEPKPTNYKKSLETRKSSSNLKKKQQNNAGSHHYYEAIMYIKKTSPSPKNLIFLGSNSTAWKTPFKVWPTSTQKNTYQTFSENSTTYPTTTPLPPQKKPQTDQPTPNPWLLTT